MLWDILKVFRLILGSIHASKVEQAMSDFGSNGSSAYIRTIPHKSWSLQLKILLCTVELYLKQGMIQDAEACLAEAETVAPVSFQVAYMVSQKSLKFKQVEKET